MNQHCVLLSQRERDRETETEREREKESRQSLVVRGGSGGAMVLGKLSVAGRPTNLVNSKPSAYCACSRCGCFFFFFWTFSLVYLFSFLSLVLGYGPILTEILFQRTIKANKSNQIQSCVV